MPIVRLSDKTPEIYSKESRDFQLLCNVFDCFVNGIKSDIDSMIDVVNTERCPSRLLPLLATRIGFFTDAELTDEDLRMILASYPHILKNKGSELAIRQCINLFQRMRKINVPTEITIENKDAVGNDKYTITIGLNTGWIDTYVLDELVKHIIPTGYAVNYVFYEKSGASVTNLAYNQVMNTLTEQDEIVSELREGEIKDDSMHDRLYGLSNAIEIFGAPNPTTSGT